MASRDPYSALQYLQVIEFLLFESRWHWRADASRPFRASDLNQSINGLLHTKDHVEIDHLIKYDAFRVNRNKVVDLKIWLKIHTNVSNFCKIPSCTYYLKKLRWKSLCLPILKSIMEIMKTNLRVCMVLRDALSCIDFEAYFKVHSLVSVHPKSIILGQMTNRNVIFHVIGSVYRFVEIWNSPQFPAEFRNGQSVSK